MAGRSTRITVNSHGCERLRIIGDDHFCSSAIYVFTPPEKIFVKSVHCLLTGHCLYCLQAASSCTGQEEYDEVSGFKFKQCLFVRGDSP